MLIGYMRVSKSDGTQVLDLQKDALKKIGVKKFFSDFASGRKDDRPGLRNCIKSLSSGDILVVWKLDRLGRNMKHLVNTVDELRMKGIGFKVVSGYGAEIDTTTANGRLFFGVFAALAEFERDLISERTKAGLQAAKKRGKIGGRPRKINRDVAEVIFNSVRSGNSVSSICKAVNITTATYYNYFYSDGSLRVEI